MKGINELNVSEYIVEYFVNKGINHIFGYQGTMIAYLIDAIYKNTAIENHCCYNEQAAAFAAVGYAKASDNVGVAYATSGPGALNLISGVADAFYDSTPTIFITGQLNTNEYTNIQGLRQQGFQETNIVEIFKPITKYCIQIAEANRICEELDKAWCIANSGRKGPVLLDIPMNIQRAEIEENKEPQYEYIKDSVFESVIPARHITTAISMSERPIFLVGNGLDNSIKGRNQIKRLAEKFDIPVISSMLGKSLFSEEDPHYLGFIGAAYGHRGANIIAFQKADLIISLGCSMCRRQTGGNTEKFAPNAKIIRIDIDEIELDRKVHQEEISFVSDANEVIKVLLEMEVDRKFSKWLYTCNRIVGITMEFENECIERNPNKYVDVISDIVPPNSIVVSDVGQHQVWVAQSFKVSGNNSIIFSGGHGAMGFALPAAIGAYYATGEKVIVISGDGAIQMNIQEFQWIYREQIPLTICIMNNSSLGLIRQQQDDFFDCHHFGSTEEGGYSAPDFVSVANAYGIESVHIRSMQELNEYHHLFCDMEKPVLLEIEISDNSKAYPKTYFGESMDNQRPYMPQSILDEIYNM